MSATIVTSTSHVSPGHGTINRTASPSNQENAGASSNMESVSGFVNKPARGWLHPDHLFAKDGINYNVRYVGCLEVNTSMKVLDFDTRSAIAKECIHRVCEASGLRTAADKKRRKVADKKVIRMLGPSPPSMEKAGSNVQLTITSLWLKLSDLDSGEPIHVHEMPNISFASGGDTDTLDFVAYVAKDRAGVRSCFVLECGGGIAQDVITTVGQAFELRFKEFLKRTPGHKPQPLQLSSSNFGDRTSAQEAHQGNFNQPIAAPAPQPRTSLLSSDRSQNESKGFPNQFHGNSRLGGEVEYYNDLPGKSPPDVSSNAKVTQQPLTKDPGTTQNRGPGFRQRPFRESVSSNLIDFNTEIPQPSDSSSSNVPLHGVAPNSFFSSESSTQQPPITGARGHTGALPHPGPEYVNGDVVNPRAPSHHIDTTRNQMHGAATATGSHRDPFDMSPFATSAPGGGVLGLVTSNVQSTMETHSNLSNQQTMRIGDQVQSISMSSIGADHSMKHQMLSREEWFHGPISRKDAEQLLLEDGDFLVRESQGSPGQYVLTGMQSNSKKHLLLVDPEGIVRTKDRTFDSVSHLINYHRDNALPIISAESALRLKKPVLSCQQASLPKAVVGNLHFR